MREFLFAALVSLALTADVAAQTAPPVLQVPDGGTGANSAGAARANLGAAAAGANGDITSLTGLTTVLPPSEGGTGATGGVSPTGSLTTTPETVVNVADYGGCSGSVVGDTANLNAALAAARSSSAYVGNQPVRLVGGFSTGGAACAVSQINATGFTRFGGGSRLIIDDLTLQCSGTGNICLDAIGSLNVQFNRVTIIGSSTSPPMIGLQEGNVSPTTIACCIHTHYGLEITGAFTFAGLYSAASESTTYYSPVIRNNGASFGVIGATGALTNGSGYANGVYSGVTLTGSATGYGAIANITVAGGQVTKVALVNQGKQYAIGDTLTAASSQLGGSGSGFSIAVTNIGQFSMVLDGQNHWGASSSFQSVNWAADTYYTFTEINIIDGSLRYYGSSYLGAPLWLGSVEGLRTVHVYMAQLAQAACIQMFDSNAANTLHNTNETLEIECESSAATSDVNLTGPNPTPKVSGLVLNDPLSTISTSVLGADPNISGVTAHGVSINVGFATTNPPLFPIGGGGIWNLDGAVSLPFAWEFNAPASNLVSGSAAGVPLANIGPLDFLTVSAGVSGAYSCARKLSFAYNGPLCNVRRASDSAAVDVYPSAGGVLDKSALTAFCAATTCFIAVEYDQSGNGNGARNATASTQPAITIEGASLNYAVCGTWGAGGSAQLTAPSNSATNNLFAGGGFASVVQNKTAALTSSFKLLSRIAGGSGWELSGAYSLGFGYLQFTVDGATAGAWVSSALISATGVHIYDVAYSYATSGVTPTVAMDGSALSFQSAVQPTGGIADNNSLVIGNSVAGNAGWPGDICEVILSRSPLNAAQTDAVRRNQAVFYGLPNVL